MSRRVYYWNPKRKQIHQEALQNFRAARSSIDPDLLETARQAIAAGMDKARETPEKAASPASKADARVPAGSVPIDRQKNLSIIMQFLELNRDNPHLLGKVKGLMLDRP